MTNADKFKGIFGIYATELWAKPEKEFLEWLNADDPETNAGDMISRQDAIDEMEEYWRSLNLRRKRISLAAESVYMDIKGVVATLPSAQPERKKGKWIPDGLIKRSDAIGAVANHLGIPAQHWVGVAEEWLADIPDVKSGEKNDY